MPKLNKHLKKLVIKMVKSSINSDGRVSLATANKVSRSLRSLTLSQSIPALSEFTKGLKREINKTTLTVESSVAVPTGLQSQIVKALSKDYKITISQFRINPSLLGGLKVKIGDTLIDNSLQSRVKQLGERITNG